MIFIFFNRVKIQALVIIIKLGIRPLHFWILSILNGLTLYLVFWFFTLQKLVYLGVLIVFYSNLFFFLIIGIFLCFIQIVFLFDYLKIILINLTERLNWLLIFIFFRTTDGVFVVFYYLVLLFFLLRKNLNRERGLNWLLVFVLINVPLSFRFFIKVYFLLSFSDYIFLFLFVLLILILIRFIGLLKILINGRLKINFKRFFENLFFIFLIQFLILFYYFSKRIILLW